VQRGLLGQGGDRPGDVSRLAAADRGELLQRRRRRPAAQFDEQFMQQFEGNAGLAGLRQEDVERAFDDGGDYPLVQRRQARDFAQRFAQAIGL